jgi:ceramide glucosyltransferase
MWLEGILIVLVTLGGIYWIIVWWSVRSFFRQARPAEPNSWPSVSILKPVKGLDTEAYENFASFCRQEYPAAPYELLFGVSDSSDPAVALVKRLQREFPQLSIRLLIATERGLNPKSSILQHLASQARHDVLVISDSDIRVTPDYLRRVVSPLEDASIGLVTCLYRSYSPLTRTLAGRLEALYLDSSFLPSAVIAQRLLKLPVGLGATMAVRRGDLERMGGYAGIADYLSDDYQVAAGITELGLKVRLSDYVVSHRIHTAGFREQWEREVRWARSIRALHPKSYPGLLLTYSTPMACGLVVASGGSPWTAGALCTALCLRWLLAYRIARDFAQPESLRHLAWLPVRDFLSAGVWCAGAVGSNITWRGTTYRLLADGRLCTQAARSRLHPGVVLASAVQWFDGMLRRYLRIYEFTSHEDCLLRLSLVDAEADVTLSDGTHVHRGERIGELHFWNEHVPPMGSGGPDVAWALVFQRALRHTMAEFAEHVKSDPRVQDVQAFRAELMFASRNMPRILRSLQKYSGFEAVEVSRPRGMLKSLHELADDWLRWLLIWTFNPHSLKQNWPAKQRHEIWITRGVLISRFGLHEVNAMGDGMRPN